MGKIFKKLDDGTFGNTPAAISLARILNETEDIKSLRKVSRRLQCFGQMLNELNEIDPKISPAIVQIIFKKFVDEDMEVPHKVLTYTRNIITGYYRAWMTQNEGFKQKKNRTYVSNNKIY